MSEEAEEYLEKARRYAAVRGIEITERLGWGIHGSVWKITGKERNFAWVLKLHRHIAPWRRERDCYRRLQEMGTSHIAGVHLPQFIRDDEKWLAIEMSVVERPFLLDSTPHGSTNAPNPGGRLGAGR